MFAPGNRRRIRMARSTAWRIFIFNSLLLFLILPNSCKREWTNPYDIPPESWAPSNLQITQNQNNSFKLTWEDNYNDEDGFKIDRKINEEAFQVAFATTYANQTTFIDDDVSPGLNFYTYKVYTYVGSLFSTPVQVRYDCGNNFLVSHVEGEVAPVNKIITYGTVETILTGTKKCWITQNLGADHTATSAIDDTEASAGWYWQFNKKQGYKHTGTTRTPYTAWISSIYEDSDWQIANDPCTLLLGNGWRLPTYSEWNNAQYSWNNYNTAFNSTLELHCAGCICDIEGGAVTERGTRGFYWSSSQTSLDNAWVLGIFDVGSSMFAGDTKALGLPVRCLRD
jgi:hypothetical protein